MCICWRKRSPGDMCVYKHEYQAPDRTTLHIQMCLDWPWQVTKRQTSSDSVPFHAPASYYLTAPLTLRALYFPSIHFYNPSFPREQAPHQSWRFSQGETRILSNISTFYFVTFHFCFLSHVTERVVLLTISFISPSAISTYMLLKLGLPFMRAHTRTPTHTTQQLSRLAYIISTRPECLILPLFVLCIDSHIW